MKRVHLILGILGLLLFLASGLYMHFGHNHLRDLDNVTRLLFRSGHIYLFFSSLLNISLGLYLEREISPGRRWLQCLGSVLILGSVPLLCIGFMLEPSLSGLDRPYARPAIYGSLAGIFLHMLSRRPKRKVPSFKETESYNHQ